MNPNSYTCSDHGLDRILSSYWLAHFYLMKKSTNVLIYFGLDCRMLKFFTHEPQSKEQFMFLPHFWSMLRQKRSWSEHMQIVIQTIRRLDSFRTFNFYQIFKIKNQKSKTYSGWYPFQGLSNGTTLMQVQSVWRYLWNKIESFSGPQTAGFRKPPMFVETLLWKNSKFREFSFT